MNNTILKKEYDFSVLKTDNCVFCNKDTQIASCTNVDMRNYYIDGAGQLCDECFVGIYDKKVLV